MYNLQKLNNKNFLLIFVLVLMSCQTTYSQEQEPDASLRLQKCWFFPTSELANLPFASDNEVSIYSALLDGKLISINSLSGEKRWESDLGGDILSAPLVDAYYIYIVSRNNNDTLTLRSINKATSVTQWKAEFTKSILPIEKVYLFNFEGYLIFVSDNGDVYSFDKENGEIIWRKSFDTKLSSQPLVQTGRLLIATSNNRVISISAYDGRLIENLYFPVSLTTIVESLNENNFILGDSKGLLISYNKKLKTTEWKFRNGGEISGITSTPKGLIISSFDNYIYLIAGTNGRLIWKKRLSGRPLDKPQFFDNYVIIAADNDSTAAVLELDSGKLVNRIILEENNYFLGDSVRIGDFVVYATSKGILSFSSSNSGGCQTK